LSPALSLYRLGTGLLEPLAPMLLRRRARQGKEDPARVEERLGFPTLGRPCGPLVWVHGASVGETLSAVPLVERIGRERPDVSVLVTSGTTTSAEILAHRLPGFALHQYVPVDAPGVVDRFLDHWRPDLVILLESEVWPNMILGAQKRGARMALVSARFTEAAQSGWSKAPGAARRILGAFDLVLPQDDASADRLSGLGARVTGRANLKLVGDPLGHDQDELERLRAAAGDRAVVVSASTHPGEEALVDSAVAGLPGRPLHLIAPRHPRRAAAIEAELSVQGRNVARRSRGEAPSPDVDAYLADTLGELGLFFRLGDVVVLGGGWAAGVGGHNPLEPARLGKAVVSGPHVANWAGVFEAMTEADAVRLADVSELAGVVASLLADPAGAWSLGERASAFARRQDGAMDQLWDHISPLVPA
jgi:3-deoxy-D-manno-octulosonic-acid transferase